MKKIYLCGAIFNVSSKKANKWRQEAMKKLPNFECLNPLDKKYGECSAKDIVNFDKLGITNADIVLVNASAPSWGTAMEILLAYQLHKIIVVFTKDKKISPWVLFHSSIITESLDDAITHIYNICQEE